jgi:polysaccharide chain length determinant protein (PEP-CTERM system associated)
VQEIIHMVLKEVRGTWRFRWLAIGVAWALCVIGWIVVYSLPDTFEARAQVYVDADSRLAEVMVEVGVSRGVGSSVFVVRQAMLGRPQLEKVAADTGLDTRAQDEVAYDLLITELQTTIQIDAGRASDARNLYTITFRDSDRLMAISVVEALLDRFVSDVLARKDEGSEQATSYLDDQLEYYGNEMTRVESDLADFKKQNIGLLPGESGGIFDRLQTEMDLVKKLNRELSIELDRREAMQNQLRSASPVLPDGGVVDGVAGIPVSPIERSIRQLETMKAELLLTYTERHPDVIAVVEQLEQLYQQRKEELEALAATGEGIEGVPNATNPIYQSLQIELNKAGVTIAGYRSEIAQHEAVIAELRGQINTIPDVEAEFSQLNRDYEQYRELYNQLLIQKERERMGEAGEERDIVSFNIIEPPSAALEPVSPRRALMLLFVLVAGIGAGAGAAYLIHLNRPVFSDVQSLRQLSGRPVLGAVSTVWSEKAKRTRSVGMVSFATSFFFLLVVFVVAVLLKDLGVELVRQLATANVDIGMWRTK